MQLIGLDEKKIFFFIILLISFSFLKGQDLQGTVYELNSNQVMPQVEVTNLHTSGSVYTNEKGNFIIPVKKDDLLSFSYPGYRIDTILVIDFDFKRVYLTPIENINILSEVEVRGMSDQQLAEEIEKAKEESESTSTLFSGGLAISPSRLFGKSAKAARKRYEFLVQEQQDRLIWKRFSPSLITSLTPLKGRDLELFRIRYKPSYDFAKSADDEKLRLYIMDSYKEYKTLDEQQKGNIELRK